MRVHDAVSDSPLCTPLPRCEAGSRAYECCGLQMSVDDAAADGGGGVAAEIFSRHRRSAQPESQQVCAALPTLLDML